VYLNPSKTLLVEVGVFLGYCGFQLAFKEKGNKKMYFFSSRIT